MMELGGSLESTATWAVAFVCAALILVSLLIEHALHLLSHFVQRRKRKTLNQAVYQLKAELRNFGFMSLLLTMAKQPISKICIPKRLGDTFLPCYDARSFNIQAEVVDSCEKGKIPLVSTEGTLQLQILIFVLAIVHVISSLATLALGEVKIKRWESWEDETRTLVHQLSNDPRRFKFTRQTSFGQRHLTCWSNHPLILWLVCFLRQFSDSVTKVDYFALRNGFIRIHLSKGSIFDFHKFLRRSLDRDFLMIVRITPVIWLYAVLVIFFNAHEFYNHYWLPFIPLTMLLVIGTKLEVVITKLCVRTKQQVLTPGVVSVKPDDNLFWFGKPKLILHAIHFILIQNSFQLAFFTWTWYKFGIHSCFHREMVDIILTVGISILVQFLSAYVTLPLYALVTQMGSSMKETVFTDDIVTGLKIWHKMAKKSLSKKKYIPTTRTSVMTTKILSENIGNKKSFPTSHLMKPLSSPRIDVPLPRAQSSVSEFRYPSGRLELLEMQRVAEEIIECSSKNIPFDGEISFRLWKKQGELLG